MLNIIVLSLLLLLAGACPAQKDHFNRFREVHLDTNGLLTWKLEHDVYPLDIKIQHRKWNKWITAGNITSSGRNNDSLYSYLVPLFNGKNEVRLAYISESGKERYSKPVKTIVASPAPCWPLRTNKNIYWKEPGKYKIYDSSGNIVLTGEGIEADVSALPRGAYYLEVNGRISEFIRSK